MRIIGGWSAPFRKDKEKARETDQKLWRILIVVIGLGMIAWGVAVFAGVQTAWD